MKLCAVLVLILVAQVYTTSGANLDHGVRPTIIELEDELRTILSDTSSLFENPTSRLPHAESFKTKINHRLDRSGPLSNAPELKQNLISIAGQKLEKCKTPNGLELDKHCVGRETGLMMQLIGAVENNIKENNRASINVVNSGIENGI